MTQLPLVTTEVTESPDGEHVWVARKTWSNKPHLNFILARPPSGSVWDNHQVQAAHHTAWTLGYGGVTITFLFSRKPPLPSTELNVVTSAEHRAVLLEEALAAKLCIISWGDLKALEDFPPLVQLMGETLRTILDGRPVVCSLGICPSGHPKEPSLAFLVKPIVWVPRDTLGFTRLFLKNSSPAA